MPAASILPPASCVLNPQESLFSFLISEIIVSGMLSPGSIVDCGAHKGGEACLYASLAPARTVHAIEPQGMHISTMTRQYGIYLPNLRPLKGDTPELTAEQRARLEEIEAEIEAANEAWEDADEDGEVEQANRVEMLEAEYRAIEKPVPIISEEQKAGALAYVVIGHDGQPRLHEQLYVAPVEEPDDEERPSKRSCRVRRDPPQKTVAPAPQPASAAALALGQFEAPHSRSDVSRDDLRK